MKAASLSLRFKSALKAFRASNRLYFEALWIGDRALSRPTKVPIGNRSGHVLLCAPGGGNIGDQAMFEAFLDQVPGSISAIVNNETAFEIPEKHRHRVTVIVNPGITGKEPFFRALAMHRLRKLLSTASSFTVVGADIMDGRYNLRSSIARFSALEMAASMGVPATALGFSWSESPEKHALRALRRLSSDVQLNMRDPRSLSRIIADGGRRAQAVSDVVFTCETVGTPTELANFPHGTGYIVVNASGLLNEWQLHADYEQIFSWAHESGLRVVVLPHVIRKGANDLPACQRLFEGFGESDDLLIERVLTPSEVRGLVSGADLVITGRMHLAIMSLACGVPAFTLATVGKVEGLYDMFRLPQLVLQPSKGFSLDVLSYVDQLEEVRLTIEEQLFEVKQLAEANFAQFRS